MSSTYQQAQKLFESKKISAAALLFEKVLKEDPNNAEAKLKLGICRFRQKDFESAEKIFRTTTSINHNDFKAWYYLGLCAERQGRENDAISAYKIVLAINPEYEAAKKKLGINKAPENNSDLKDADTEGAGRVVYSGRRRARSYTFHLLLLTIFSMCILFYSGASNTYITGTLLGIYMIVSIILFDLIIRSRVTKYIIYERRIDIKTGILFRKHLSCWLYEITNITFSRNPINLLTGDSTITIEAEKLEYDLIGMSAPKSPGSKLSALKFMQTLFDTLRNTVREERGRVKKFWI